jgi:ABC-2 type transport system permease protein
MPEQGATNVNTQSNVALESSFESSAAAPAVIPAGRRFYWSVRREIWENGSIYLAPLAVAALMLIGGLISVFHLRGAGVEFTDLSKLTPMQRAIPEQVVAGVFQFISALLTVTTFIVAVFYCLDALHGERQDRSILFWKSLPVSDLLTILSKATIPVMVLPLVTFAITVVTQASMLLLSRAVLIGTGWNAVSMGDHASLFQGWLMLLYHLVAIQSLWYAPIYGWLLLVSAWARRAPLLWATLPLLAISIVEKIAFHTSYFASMLRHRLGFNAQEGLSFSVNNIAPLSPGHFLISPGLWIGLAVAGVFLAAAVQMRRYRGPM